MRRAAADGAAPQARQGPAWDDEPTPTIQISIEELLARAGGLAPAPPPLQVIGWWVFRLLLAFIALSFAALAVFAWLTYPSMAAVPPALWQEAQAQWFQQIKEMGQIFILTPLLPLLGAVLGYIFGRQEQKAED